MKPYAFTFMVCVSTLAFIEPAFAGHFYVNLLLKGPTHKEVLGELKTLHRSAIISPTLDSTTCVYDAECDRQDEKKIDTFSSKVSKDLNCIAWSVLNHDDDLLVSKLYQKGQLEADFAAGKGVAYFGKSLESLSAQPLAVALCREFGKPELEKRIEEALKKSQMFEFNRHAEILKLLGLPEYAMGGYQYAHAKDLPGADEENQELIDSFERVGGSESGQMPDGHMDKLSQARLWKPAIPLAILVIALVWMNAKRRSRRRSVKLR